MVEWKYLWNTQSLYGTDVNTVEFINLYFCQSTLKASVRQRETNSEMMLCCVCRYYPFPTGDWSVTADFLKCPTPTNHKSWACTKGRSSCLMTCWWYGRHYSSSTLRTHLGIPLKESKPQYMLSFFHRLLKFSKRRRTLWRTAFGSPSHFMACKCCSSRISVSAVETLVLALCKGVSVLQTN